ncbi:MAG: hypothetical protein JSV35_04870 [Candidatus Bathyarchaeota archaeon]|nr:MAG: hypothetical protein JSV35_04870 [Candidatus Bathyarchaeota archaeon]
MGALETSMEKWKSANLWGKESVKDIRQCLFIKDGWVSMEFCDGMCIASDCEFAHGFENHRKALNAAATRRRIIGAINDEVIKAIKRVVETYDLESVFQQEKEARILWFLSLGESSTASVANFLYPDEETGFGSPLYITVEKTLRQMNHKGLVEESIEMMWRRTNHAHAPIQ